MSIFPATQICSWTFYAVISTSYALYNLFLILVQAQKLLRYADATKYYKMP